MYFLISTVYYLAISACKTAARHARKNGSKKDAVEGLKKRSRHPLASVAKKTLLTRIPRLVYHHHAQRKDEPTGVPAHEIVAMFRSKLVRRARLYAAGRSGEGAHMFLEVTAGPSMPV